MTTNAYLRQYKGDKKVAFGANYTNEWKGSVKMYAKSGKAVLIHFKGTDKAGNGYDFERWVPLKWKAAVNMNNEVYYDLPIWEEAIPNNEYTKNNL